jgi:hypothetical protein
MMNCSSVRSGEVGVNFTPNRTFSFGGTKLPLGTTSIFAFISFPIPILKLNGTFPTLKIVKSLVLAVLYLH